MGETLDAQELRTVVNALLGSAALFADLKPLELGVLLQDAVPCRFRRGDFVLREGSEGRVLYVIYQGRVQVQKAGDEGEAQWLAELGPAECIGELALVDHSRRSADIVALEDSVLLQLDESMLLLHPAAGVKIYRNLARILAHRLREASTMKAWWDGA